MAATNALIGTCLSRGELRKLAREHVYETPRNCDDYQLHVHFIKISDRNDTAAKTLHKYLEKKYRTESKKYLKAETEEEIVATVGRWISPKGALIPPGGTSASMPLLPNPW